MAYLMGEKDPSSVLWEKLGLEGETADELLAAAKSFPFCRPVFSRENGRNIRRRLFICFFHQAFRDRDAHYGGSFVPGKVKENAGGMQAVLQFKEFLFIKRLVRG